MKDDLPQWQSHDLKLATSPESGLTTSACRCGNTVRLRHVGKHQRAEVRQQLKLGVASGTVIPVPSRARF